MSNATWIISFLCSLSSIALCLLFLDCLSSWLQHKKKCQQTKIIETQFTHILLTLSASLRAGMNLPSALQQLSQTTSPPLREELLRILHDQRIGMDINTALENASERFYAPNIKMALTIMQVAQSSGGPLAHALEKIAHTIRNQTIIQDKINALTAQGRLQGKVLSLLPILLIFVLQLIEPETMNALWQTSNGWMALGAIFTLEILGIMTIQRLTRLEI